MYLDGVAFDAPFLIDPTLDYMNFKQAHIKELFIDFGDPQTDEEGRSEMEDTLVEVS